MVVSGGFESSVIGLMTPLARSRTSNRGTGGRWGGCEKDLAVRQRASHAKTRRAAAFPRTPPGNPPRSRASPSSYSSYEFDLVHWPVRRDHSDRSVIGRSSSI